MAYLMAVDLCPHFSIFNIKIVFPSSTHKSKLAIAVFWFTNKRKEGFISQYKHTIFSFVFVFVFVFVLFLFLFCFFFIFLFVFFFSHKSAEVMLYMFESHDVVYCFPRIHHNMLEYVMTQGYHLFM